MLKCVAILPHDSCVCELTNAARFQLAEEVKYFQRKAD